MIEEFESEEFIVCHSLKKIIVGHRLDSQNHELVKVFDQKYAI